MKQPAVDKIKASGISQVDLAEFLGVSHEIVNRWMNNPDMYPGPTNRKKLRKIIPSLTIADLVNIED